jgi:hypothetical protein
VNRAKRDALRALLTDATPAPWAEQAGYDYGRCVVLAPPSTDDREHYRTIAELPKAEESDEEFMRRCADTVLIAEARNALPALLDALDANERALIACAAFADRGHDESCAVRELAPHDCDCVAGALVLARATIARSREEKRGE